MVIFLESDLDSDILAMLCLLVMDVANLRGCGEIRDVGKMKLWGKQEGADVERASRALEINGGSFQTKALSAHTREEPPLLPLLCTLTSVFPILCVF